MITTPIARQIINHVQAQLTTAVAAQGLTAAQVHPLTTIQTDPVDLPDITVFLVEDKPKGDEEETDSAGGQTRVLTFAVAVVFNSLQESATDALAMAIRKTILSDPMLGGLAFNTTWGPQQWGEGNTSKATVATKLIFNSSYQWSPEW